MQNNMDQVTVDIRFKRRVADRTKNIQSLAFAYFKGRVFYTGIITNLGMKQEQSGLFLLVFNFQNKMIPHAHMGKTFGTKKIIHMKSSDKLI